MKEISEFKDREDSNAKLCTRLLSGLWNCHIEDVLKIFFFGSETGSPPTGKSDNTFFFNFQKDDKLDVQSKENCDECPT